MSMALYRQGMKGCWKLLVIFASVLTMYFTIIVTMFDPELGTALDELAQAMPDLMAMVGMTQAGNTLVGFMASYLYGFVMLVFPMVYSILTANRLMAKQVDRGSMAYLLAAPVSRRRIVLTQMKVLATGIFLLVAYATLVGVVSCEAFFPGELDIPKYLLMSAGALALQLFIGGVCFLASSIFNDTKYSLCLGAGIPALGFVLQMLANSGDELASIRYATFFTLFHPKDILAGEASAYWGVLALAGGALLLYALSMIIFEKKDIPV